MSRGIGAICLGLFILMLAWAVWAIDKNFWGWLVLFLPGGFYVLRGCAWVVEDE
jgi:hypothetical protein